MIDTTSQRLFLIKDSLYTRLEIAESEIFENLVDFYDLPNNRTRRLNGKLAIHLNNLPYTVAGVYYEKQFLPANATGFIDYEVDSTRNTWGQKNVFLTIRRSLSLGITMPKAWFSENA